jgi:hypothetical protein
MSQPVDSALSGVNINTDHSTDIIEAEPNDHAVQARTRQKAVINAFTNAQKNLAKDEILNVSTRSGSVQIFNIVTGEDAEGVTWVDIYLAGEVEGGDSHFRIFNPPTLVADNNGDVLVGKRRFRVDPVVAIAEVIAANGGRRRSRR